MNESIISLIDRASQAPPLTPSKLDGYAVSHHIELAAMLVHEEVRLLTGARLAWLECTAAYRNSIRAGIEALVLDARIGDVHHG